MPVCLLASYQSRPALPSLAEIVVDDMQGVMSADLPALLEQVLAVQRDAYDIPGAAVAVVKNGKVLFLNGYGFANLLNQTPVTGEDTLFRVGSISKLLTWTAVMQLVEQGKLDLHTDLNNYLIGLRIPSTFQKPVTMAHLLTHSSGFEYRAFGFYARTADDSIPLRVFLADKMPSRVSSPGMVSAYSNYAAALAGHVVELISGVPFEQYADDHILKPLNMAHTSFRQPLPAELGAQLATGYRGSANPGSFQWHLALPAGSLSTTAADMARFMIAHLQQGRLGSARVLQENTAKEMQRRQFANHERVSGLTYGFQELRMHGERIIWHAGDTLYFSTALFLLPEHKLGLFVAYNRAPLPHARLELLEAVLTRYYPQMPWLQPTPPSVSEVQATRFVGSYRSTRSNETTLERVRGLFVPVRVYAREPGRLHITGLAMVPNSLWVAQEPLVFRDIASAEIVAFREDDRGRITHMFEGNVPTAGYARVPWYGVPELHFNLLGICVLVFLSAVIGWPVIAWLRHSKGTREAPHFHLALWIAGTMCALNLAFLSGLFVVLANLRELLFGTSLPVSILLFLPLMSLALTMLALTLGMLVWRRKCWSVWRRLHYTLVVFASSAFLGSLHYWNLLGYRI